VIGVVPAAGEGTRLRPLTDDRPKPLVDVAGEPLLAHVLGTLADSGVEAFVVIVGYRGGDVLARFGESFRGRPITYVHQRDRLGLGHAVCLAEPHVDEPFVVLNGDNVVAGTLERPLARFRERDADAVVAVEAVDRERARETGVVTLADDRVTGIVEKPDEPPSALAATGCYVLTPELFDALALLRPSARGEYELADALGVLVRAGADVRAAELGCERVNVNTPADLEHAAALVGE